jgi:hypothetical protein
VVGQYAWYTHASTGDDSFASHTAQAAVTMYDIDPLTNEYGSQKWNGCEELRESRMSSMRRYSVYWDVINLEAGSQVADPDTIWGIAMCHNNHLNDRFSERFGKVDAHHSRCTLCPSLMSAWLNM